MTGARSEGGAESCGQRAVLSVQSWNTCSCNIWFSVANCVVCACISWWSEECGLPVSSMPALFRAGGAQSGRACAWQNISLQGVIVLSKLSRPKCRWSDLVVGAGMVMSSGQSQNPSQGSEPERGINKSQVSCVQQLIRKSLSCSCASFWFQLSGLANQ